MGPERITPHSASVSDDMTAPQLPSMPDALPIAASDTPSMPRPRTRDRRQTQNSLTMELLSRRMSRQTLLQQQQNQPRTFQPPLTPRLPQPAMSAPSHSLAVSSLTVDIEVDETYDNDASPPSQPSLRTENIRPSRRYLPLPYVAPVAPATTIDPDVAARVMARLQASTQPGLESAPLAANPRSAPVIEIDPTELVDTDMDADEGYGEENEEFPWLAEKPSSGLTGALRSQGLLSFTTSVEAALRCPKLVRNVPRMRKRTQKKKEHRLRTSRDTSGQPSQAQTSAAGAHLITKQDIGF